MGSTLSICLSIYNTRLHDKKNITVIKTLYCDLISSDATEWSLFKDDYAESILKSDM